MSYLRSRRAVQAGAQRGQGPFLRVPAADQTGGPGRREPGLREPGPALGGGLLEPLVVGRGRRVPFVGVAVGGQQACRVGEFDPERGDGLGHVQGDRRPLQVADAEAARAHDRGPALVPVLQQLLDRGERGVRLPGRRRVHNLWTVRRLRLDRGRHRLDLPVRAPGPQMQGHFTREYDRAGRRRQQQTPVDEPAQPGRRVGGDLAVRRAPDQPVEHLKRLLGGAGEQRLHPAPGREQLGQ